MSFLLDQAVEALEQRRLCEALAVADEAERRGAEVAECRALRWQAHMLRGDFEAAWRESDALRAANTPDPHRFWNGELISGRRVILRSLHGLGDAIQMLRYVPLLMESSAQLTVELPPRLLELAPYVAGLERAKVMSWEQDAPEWEMQVEVMELPYLFRTQAANLPIATGYLKLPPEIAGRAAGLMGAKTRPRVGLVWSSGGWNPARSIPFELMAEVVRNADYDFWSLQHGDENKAAWDGLGGAANLHSLMQSVGDGIVPLAAVIENLDLVITVDTLAAHLAGALGVPTFLLLQHAADWRWQDRRCDSPWYPSLRIFRQPAPGDWFGVIQQILVALRESEFIERLPEAVTVKT